MENMKAVRIHQYVGPEVLRFEDAPRPVPGFTDLLIRVRAAGVNPVDWKIRAGYMKDFRPYTFPLILGWDLSGAWSRHWGPALANLRLAMRFIPGPT